MPRTSNRTTNDQGAAPVANTPDEATVNDPTVPTAHVPVPADERDEDTETVTHSTGTKLTVKKSVAEKLRRRNGFK